MILLLIHFNIKDALFQRKNDIMLFFVQIHKCRAFVLCKNNIFSLASVKSPNLDILSI